MIISLPATIEIPDWLLRLAVLVAFLGFLAIYQMIADRKKSRKYVKSRREVFREFQEFLAREKNRDQSTTSINWSSK